MNTSQDSGRASSQGGERKSDTGQISRLTSSSGGKPKTGGVARQTKKAKSKLLSLFRGLRPSPVPAHSATSGSPNATLASGSKVQATNESHDQHPSNNTEVMSDQQRRSGAGGDTSGVQHQSTSHIASCSNSPTPSSLHSSHRSSSRTSLAHHPSGPQSQAFNTRDIKVLLLENVNEVARRILQDQGYQVEFYSSSLPKDKLIEKIRDVDVIGIRSKTKLSEEVLREAKKLLAIGCFCIGTNQVDLEFAARRGIVVFNSPFSNSRSVAELVISEIIALARQLGDRSSEMHNGIWNKVSARCWEIRGKTLGIVGYGHIGSQLSVLSEAMGMKVIYYDVVSVLSVGTARRVSSLESLLREADFVSIHVPELEETRNMIGAKELECMKPGGYIINASRGSVVDIPALIASMRSGHTAGAALDVYPHEPAGNGNFFDNSLSSWVGELRGLKNLILTPHIGGSTEEAQTAIGTEVGEALVRYISAGNTQGAVNMPNVIAHPFLPGELGYIRVIFIHVNQPGVLGEIGVALGIHGHNVERQVTDSRGDVAYFLANVSNVNQEDIPGLYERLEDLGAKIRTRVLHNSPQKPSEPEIPGCITGLHPETISN